MIRIASSILISAASLLGACQHQPTPPRDSLPVWAFCGVDPSAPGAAAAVRVLAVNAGVDATFGPCNVPPPNYTAALPGSRYSTPAVYAQLVHLNASVGMHTIVYDARLWNGDPAVRQQAVDFWRPMFPWITAWDMGDEFSLGTDPHDMAVFSSRWYEMHGEIMQETGIPPFTNNTGGNSNAEAFLTLPGAGDLFSYDEYITDQDASLAAQYRPRIPGTLVCAVDGSNSAQIPVTAQSLMVSLVAHRNAGCTAILFFGGGPSNAVGYAPSLYTGRSTPTPLASVLLNGVK